MAFFDIYAEGVGTGSLREVDALTDPERPSADKVVYRGVFRGMNLFGMPDELKVGKARVFSIMGPLLTQKTDVIQRSGFPLVFDKRMEHRTEVGAGHRLSVVQIERSPIPEDLSALMIECREESRAAIALVAALLDERIAQEQLAEDLIFLQGEEAIAAADLRQRIRSFLPYEVRGKEMQALLSLENADVPRHVQTAARWYLRGAQTGPQEDGVIFLWFAVETLVGSSKKGAIENALREAGKDPADQQIGIGQLHGLRSQIVHDKPDKAPPDPELIRDGYYDLEGMVRALLRHAVGARSSWPMHFGARVFQPPWDSRIQEAWLDPQVEFHEDALCAGEPASIPGLAWTEIAPPIDTATELKVRGGQGQDAQRLRRVAEVALAYYDDPDLGELLIQIKRFEDDRLQGRCEKERIEVSSKVVNPKEPIQAIHLAELIHKFIGRTILEHRGVSSASSAGHWLHGVLCGWVGYDFLTNNAGMPADMFRGPILAEEPNPFEEGEQLGAGLAGDKPSWSAFKDRADVSDETEAAFQVLLQVESPAELVERLGEVFDSMKAP